MEKKMEHRRPASAEAKECRQVQLTGGGLNGSADVEMERHGHETWPRNENKTCRWSVHWREDDDEEKGGIKEDSKFMV